MVFASSTQETSGSFLNLFHLVCAGTVGLVGIHRYCQHWPCRREDFRLCERSGLLQF